MAIKSEKIEGKFIINEYDSTNLGKTTYNTETNPMKKCLLKFLQK